MGKLTIQLLCSIVFISLILHALADASHQVGHGKEFDYKDNGEMGPAKWGKLSPEWSACSEGLMQSPVDLVTAKASKASNVGKLTINYKPSSATLKNRGHDMMLEWISGGGAIKINGTEFVLSQCHWHSPSEHSIDGKRSDLEMHMVHKSQDGKIAVIGILHKLGTPNSFLLSLTDKLKLVAGPKQAETVVGLVNPNDIKLGTEYFRYMGSLTTPPCTENIIWTVMKNVESVSKEQLKSLRVAVQEQSGTNARPIQPINQRSVKLIA